jgi:high-affinity Fe2+/Pb2+ permease
MRGGLLVAGALAYLLYQYGSSIITRVVDMGILAPAL